MRIRDRIRRGIGYLFPALIVFPTALTGNLARDEQMYVTAGALVRDHALYHDFAYFQMPYLPWLYAPVLSLGGGQLLLPLRLATALAFWALALVMQRTVDRLTGSWGMGIAASVLVLCSETVLLAGGLASNHMPALLCFAGAMLCAVEWTRRRERRILMLGFGFWLGVAVGLRLTYLAYLPLALIFLSVNAPGDRKRPTLYALAGAGLALLPAFVWFLRDPSAFWFNNLQYHLANTRWWETTALGTTMDWPAKLSGTWDFLEDSSHLPLWILATLCTTHAGLQGGFVPLRPVLVGAGFFFASLVLAVLPRPVPVLYYLPAVLGLVVWLALGVRALSGRARRVGMVLFVGSVLIAVGDAGEDLMGSWRGFLQPGSWTSSRVREQVAPYRDEIAGNTVATISPVHALEAGARIPLEFSTGPFFYRVGDTLRADQRRRFHGTSMSTVAQLLESSSPVAVLTGVDGNSLGWDEPFVRWARVELYRPQNLEDSDAILWLAPEATEP